MQLRGRGVDAVYLTDRPTWSFHYRHLRAAGVQRIFVHDRTSGMRRRGNPIRYLAKRAAHQPRAISGDCFIGVSRFVRDRLVHVNGTPAARTFTVYNGIDLRRLAGAPPADLPGLLGVSAHTPIVFCAGRAQPYKGIQTVIDAAALMRDQQVAFVFCGDGSYRTQLEARVAELGLQNFYFLGRRDDVPSLLKAATIAVIPSWWAEAFGLTVVEAMAAGVPLIATRVGGIPELVQDGVTGVLIEPGDAVALADALQSLLASPAQRAAFSEAGANLAKLRFSLTRVANDLYELIAPQLAPARADRSTPRATLAMNA
jgi:glycosyltransferase involved in cell wall biosynthesis